MTELKKQPITATFLTDKQIWGDEQGKGQLQVMKSYGKKTGMSDLAIALGGSMGLGMTIDNQRTGAVWSASSQDSYVYCVNNLDYGDWSHYSPCTWHVGARPVLSSLVASSLGPSNVSAEALAKGEAKQGEPIKDQSGHVIWQDVILYGEYPQTIAPEEISKKLEEALTTRELQATGKKYTFENTRFDFRGLPFNAERSIDHRNEYQYNGTKEYIEYKHNDKRYIRVEANPYDEDSVLSNGHKPKAGEACWIEVQPIEWLRDPSGMLVARQALFAGVRFDGRKSYDRKFEDTDMYNYLQEHFVRDAFLQHGLGQAASAGTHVANQRDREKQKLQPIINAALDSLGIELTSQQRAAALNAAVDKQAELHRQRG